MFLTVLVKQDEEEKGVYLFWDSCLCGWIRSGAVFGKSKTFGTRYVEHFEGSKTRSSLFYKFYPSREVREDDDEFARGTFEILLYKVAFTSNKIKNISSKLQWPQGFKQKFQDMDDVDDFKFTDTTYALELCAQLLMSPNMVVSESQGFEKRFRGKLNEATNDTLADV